MKGLFKYFGAIFVAILVLGCGGGTPVYVAKQSTLLSEQKATLSDVESAIREGAAKRKWSVKKESSGLLSAQMNAQNKYPITVTISFTEKGYMIEHKESQNLKYDAATQTIHPSYNKWIKNLENDINYELSKIGIDGYKAPAISAAAVGQATSGGDVNLDGKTIYIKSLASYAPDSPIAQNIKTECTLDKQVMDFIQQYATKNGQKVEIKNNIAPNEIELKITIMDAVSSGNAFIGHRKYTKISGALIQNNKTLSSFTGSRISGGGAFGGYKGSCSVLGRTVDTLGKDVSSWLSNPIDNARLGDGI